MKKGKIKNTACALTSLLILIFISWVFWFQMISPEYEGIETKELQKFRNMDEDKKLSYVSEIPNKNIMLNVDKDIHHF